MRARCWRWFTLSLLVRISSADRCSFTLDSRDFDLCSLFKVTTTIPKVEETPPTRNTIVYDISLGTPLKRDGTLSDELQCPEGTWICLTVQNTRPSHPSEPMRILQVIPVAVDLGLNPTAKMLAKADADDVHAPLEVTLHGGLYNGQPQQAAFQLHCDHGLDEPTPSFSWQRNGTHNFSWRTKSACPLELPPGAPGSGPGEPLDADVDTTRRASLSLYLILFWVVAFLVAFRFFYPSLSRWSRRLSSGFLMTGRTGKGFRPSASSLVRWAAEEDPEEYDIDETDGFIHGLSGGEETPLTPNSKTTFMAGRYGSA